MTDPAHARAKALFLAALDRPEPERAAFLAEASSDDPLLRAEVEALLACHVPDSGEAAVDPATLPRFQPGDVFAGRYRMVVPLGSGGMGEVWRADDLVVGGPVALKLLHAPDAARRAALLNEARLARQVTSPAVCRVFDIGEHEGEAFLSMEFVRGEDLASLLRRVGRLPVETALDLGGQICDGLTAAHACGVWHRDLKPGNILIDERGRARITDFGIAATRHAPHAGRAGTPGYMAPEQEAPAGAAGPAADLWALGVVLVEMLTGARPSGAEAPATLPSETPEKVRDLIERCLVVDPSARLADAAAARIALHEARLRPGDAVADRSVLVLPFANLSADAGNEYFSDGLTEEVIAGLSRIESLRVISRATAMRFKGRPVDLAEVARELRVRYVLDGSVRKTGDRLRIVAHLADSRGDRAIWSETYTRTLDGVFDIEEQVARAIAGALAVHLSADDERRLARRQPTTGAVLDLCLRARRDILSFDAARLSRAQAALERAHALDEGDVLVCATLGTAYWQAVNTGFSTDAGLIDKAEACARRVLGLDPAGPHGPALLAHLAATRGRIDDWLRYGAQTLAAAPRDPDALVWLGMGWTWAGRPDAARPIFDRLETIDPLYDYLHFGLALVEQTEARFERALGPIRRARALQPDMVAWPLSEIQILLQLGRRAEAATVMAAALPAPGAHPLADMTRALVAACHGEADAARRLLTPDLAARLWPDLQYAYFVSQIHAALGDGDESLRWLEQSARRGFVHHPYLAERDPLLAPLRRDPRFGALMEMVREEWVRVGRSAP